MQATITTQTLTNSAGLNPAGYRTIVTKDGGTYHNVTNPGPTPVVFTANQPGSYVATVQRLSDGGASMGPSVSSDPLVLSGPATFEAPLTVTLSL